MQPFHTSSGRINQHSLHNRYAGKPSFALQAWQKGLKYNQIQIKCSRKVIPLCSGSRDWENSSGSTGMIVPIIIQRLCTRDKECAT